MNIIEGLKNNVKEIANISEYIDTDAAAKNIRNNIYFKGPNVWILAFSIIIASVGLNINSTAVIIGAMLISPLMGPIFGIGLGMGINDTQLIKKGLKNLGVMVAISIIASSIYFFISPLDFANPTELESRTNPTLYDVLIALFGGFAGIFELSRKERGTVISGVAIATALMPPLCTAGYGLANLNFAYFFGALFLFFINGVCIIFATYIACKQLGYKEYPFQNEINRKKARTLISIILIGIMIPSIWSATIMIKDNRFYKQIASYVAENKNLTSNFIYDYKINYKNGGHATLYIAGQKLSVEEKGELIQKAIEKGIKPSQLEFKQHEYNPSEQETSQKIIKGIYERTDVEMSKRDEEISKLKMELKDIEQSQIPYLQIFKELKSQYSNINDIYIGRGADIQNDSLSHEGVLLIIKSSIPILPADIEKINNWLKVRLNDDQASTLNIIK